MAAELSSLPVPMPVAAAATATATAKGAAASPTSVVAAESSAGNDFNSLLSQLLQPEAPTTTTVINPALADGNADVKDQETLEDLTTALAQAQVPDNVIAMVTDLVARETLPTAVDQAAIAAALANGQATTSDARANAAQWLARAQALLQQGQATQPKGGEAVVKDSQWQNQLTQALQAQSLQAQSGGDNLSDGNQGDPNANDTGSQTTSDIDSLAAAYSQSHLKAENRTELQIQARVGSPVWREEVGAKISWMIERGIQHGTLRLSPDNMGPMEVRISTQNDQVSVWFGAAHADTRAALENALPRLREMFASQGLQLADAGVFREPPRDTPRQYSSSSNGDAGAMTTEDIAVSVRQSRGILDAYA